MSKFWKSKKFLGGLFTLVLVTVGVANPELLGEVGAAVVCEGVKCDA